MDQCRGGGDFDSSTTAGKNLQGNLDACTVPVDTVMEVVRDLRNETFLKCDEKVKVIVKDRPTKRTALLIAPKWIAAR